MYRNTWKLSKLLNKKKVGDPELFRAILDLFEAALSNSICFLLVHVFIKC